MVHLLWTDAIILIYLNYFLKNLATNNSTLGDDNISLFSKSTNKNTRRVFVQAQC